MNELILQLGEHPDDIATRVETYNRKSFIEWKNEQVRAPRTNRLSATPVRKARLKEKII